ncbi:MAG: orotidine-5'-phosphate decarboxylase [Actinomycetota bacterium]|nr:orotidine-5'-phosphate decarboxylase [Actinomycetota bacterium]
MTAAAPAPADGFGDLVAARVASRRSQLVLGLDPDPVRLWPRALELTEQAGLDAAATSAERAATAVRIHCGLAIEAAGEQCVAVKLQVACFERLGGPGWEALREVSTRAGNAGLLVIADAKRGDIDVSASAYAQAFFGETQTAYGPVRGLGVDAITANPLLGLDSLLPLVAGAREHGGGIFVLVRTSNPGAADLQELALRDGGTVAQRLAAVVSTLGGDGVGAAGLADVGAVVGATAPERLRDLRDRMPAAILLLPGVGAQGGRVEDLAPAFAPGPAAALVTVSRGLVLAHELLGGDPAAAAAAEAARIRDMTWRLAQ